MTGKEAEQTGEPSPGEPREQQPSRVEDLLSATNLLRFESTAPRTLGAKEDAIRAELGISPIRYYQKLNRAIDTPEAMQEFPLLTARLRRKRDSRADRRSGAHSD